MNCDEKIHKIMQEEIADRVGYQDKFCELTLSRGLESAESRLSTVLQQARLEEREAVARTIGLSASTAGLSPKDLAKDDDWKEAVEKIKRSEREALKKVVEKVGDDITKSKHQALSDLLNEINK